MSSFAASDSDEPPRKTNKPPSSSSSPSMFFSSLPNELLVKIISRVPRRYYPILSCVSNNFRNIVFSPEIHEVRSVLGLDSLYICFSDSYSRPQNRNWYTLCRIENNPTQNLFTPIHFPSPPDPNYSSVIAIGPEIFFIGGSLILSSSLWIYDSRSGTFRQGPNMQVERTYNSSGLVGGKIYVIGGYRRNKIQAESFDLKKQIWEVAPDPKIGAIAWICTENVSLDKKIYALSSVYGMTCYDTSDGSCESFELPSSGHEWWWTGVCVIENVLYVYFVEFGLMWFDTKMKLWRVVDGLSHLGVVDSVGLAEYYGKLAFVWQKSSDVERETEEVWFRMIALDKSEVGICGTAEPSCLLGTVPGSYRLLYCLSLSG